MQSIRDQAAWTFRRQRNILDSLHWLRENPDQGLARLDVFNLVIRRLDEEISRPRTDIPEGYRDVIKLKEMLGNKSLPTLESLRKTVVRDDHRSPVADIVQTTFSQAGETFPSWTNETKDRPSTLTSGILIEGFGLLLGNLLYEEHRCERYSFGEHNPERKEKLKRTFVLAFEEVLFTEFRDSELLSDVLPWMKEEKNDFPEEIASKL